MTSTSTASTCRRRDLDELFAIDRDSWLREADLTEEFYATFGGRVPPPLQAELAALRYRLQRP